MKMAIISFLAKFLSLDSICTVIARCIALVLQYASKRGGKAWDIAKSAIVNVNMWTSLFMQVYDDEKLTPEEEKLIADAIKEKTNVSKIVDILKARKEKEEEKAM